jgi:hypothetical protein
VTGITRNITLSTTRSRPGRLAWGFLVIDLALLVAFLPLEAAGCGAFVDRTAAAPGSTYGPLLVILTGLAFAILGVLITTYRPENRIGWLACWIGLSNLVMIYTVRYTTCGFAGSPTLPGAGAAAWLANLLLAIPIVLMFILLPLWFPTGRYLSPGWRRFAAIPLAVIAAVVALTALLPGPLAVLRVMGAGSFPNAFALRSLPDLPVFDLARQSASLLLSLASLGAIASLVVRWRTARGETRQQLKWLAYFLLTAGAALMAVEVLGGLLYPAVFESWFYLLILSLSWLGFPTVIGITILRFRLYDIDLIIRRTLVYALLTVVLALVYFGTVVLLQQAFRSLTGQTSPIAVVLTTLVIAAMFNPLRGRIQSLIDLRFYRRRYDTERTLAAFSSSLRSQIDVGQLAGHLVAAVQESVQPEHAALWLRKTETRPG